MNKLSKVVVVSAGVAIAAGPLYATEAGSDASVLAGKTGVCAASHVSSAEITVITDEPHVCI